MVRAKEPPAASSLLLDEYFAAADARFLGELFAWEGGKRLAAFGERWYRDRRPFARESLLRYIDDGCARQGHRPLVKKLFKLAEGAGDDEAMGHFLVAFDRLPRRRLIDLPRYDYNTRAMTTVPALVGDRAIPSNAVVAEQRGVFSRKTRTYLCRRTFRYFRAIGRKDPARYGTAIRAALARYTDADLARPEQLLDAWSLLHALYHGSPVLDRDPSGVRVARGATLADLLPAPLYPAAWRGVFEPLIELLTHARSRTVTAFTVAWLRDQYRSELRALPVSRVLTLLRNTSGEVLTLGLELLRASPDLATLPIETWLELLRLDDLDALTAIADLVAKHVTAERLTLAQCVALASARTAPVAELGFAWVRARPVRNEDELLAVLPLANAGAPVVRAPAAAWLVDLVSRESFARPVHLRDLLDARFRDARAPALALLARPDGRFRDDLTLWSALAESPYDDVRDALLARMEQWENSLAPDTVRHAWATALLAVHRGGRAKRTVLTRVASRLSAHPDEAPVLVPLLRVALRSVRAPERRAALASIARAAHRVSTLRETLAREFPELRFVGEVSA